MMTADSLHISEHLIVPSDVPFLWLSPCRCVCSAGAFAQHFAQPPAPSSYVQASCLEHARPVAVATFAGGLAAGSAAPPDRRRPERKRGAKAEGKIKGRGTQPLENPVCTWGWRGTRQEVAACRVSAQCRIGIGEGACFTRPAAQVLDGGVA
ncbi:hypothetical protein DF021_31020 [Burkholderia stagnalis]|uniref:Uncharacterized protein n=1 Tax=Burkholderia stagnalis TaxID=1503054 RepID=A0ABX9YLK8_9BURK|nr:hypothetical protein DF158_22140 [Burkholderia stagnalis]RQQ66761.1 hypothetical protein DF137_20840 [Burkholderia stagnalis]RQQ68151.1 hypothetical protein DF139_19205 [Burkholderia stagnalis]RQQ78639.1 hypothetical protein DF138_20670 [Burkholderia stagnalis]RQQ88002.1 hypothetical protein DF134_21290 [Burkholderia stagnalis]